MSDLQILEFEIAKLPPEQQYLVRDCAHLVQQVVDRYDDFLVAAMAVHLVAARQQETIKY